MIGAACLSLSLHLASAHFGAQRELYNENNYGLGVNCSSWHVGAYRNSLYRTSAYAGRSFTWCLDAFCAGGLAAIVTGYRAEVAPVLLPLVSFGTDWRVNFIGAPRTDSVPGFVGMSIEIPVKGWR